MDSFFYENLQTSRIASQVNVSHLLKGRKKSNITPMKQSKLTSLDGRPPARSNLRQAKLALSESSWNSAALSALEHHREFHITPEHLTVQQLRRASSYTPDKRSAANLAFLTDSNL